MQHPGKALQPRPMQQLFATEWHRDDRLAPDSCCKESFESHFPELHGRKNPDWSCMDGVVNRKWSMWQQIRTHNDCSTKGIFRV